MFIKLANNLFINCLFWSITEIGNYIDPRQVKNLEDHLLVIKYLETISNFLGKKAILTFDDEIETIYIQIEEGAISFLNPQKTTFL